MSVHQIINVRFIHWGVVGFELEGRFYEVWKLNTHYQGVKMTKALFINKKISECVPYL